VRGYVDAGGVKLYYEEPGAAVLPCSRMHRGSLTRLESASALLLAQRASFRTDLKAQRLSPQLWICASSRRDLQAAAMSVMNERYDLIGYSWLATEVSPKGTANSFR
jgi:hypothetical protein